MNSLLTKVVDNLLQKKSVVLVGSADSGKTYWVKNTLIPYLESISKSVEYLKDGHELLKGSADIVICDEVETLFDKEYLQGNSLENYYTEEYLNTVCSEWYKNYSNLPLSTLYVITRNEPNQINNLLQNFKKADWDNREIETIGFSSHLYHGSTIAGIKILEPKHRYSPAGKIEYDVIYATPMKAYAAAHSFPWSTDEGVDLDVEDEKVVFAVPKSFRERLQVPISIYKISSENFMHTKEEKTGRTWHAIQSTPIIEEEKFESVESALKTLGAELKYK